jgi:sterol desaturase/sphingolipid hydroxylase (fatty acid hydroxylase superfamily)
VWKVYVYMGLVAIEQLSAIAFAANRTKTTRRTITNVVLMLAWTFIGVPLLSMPVEGYAGTHPLWHRPAWMQGGAFVVVDLMMFDLFMWTLHRLSHKNKFLWRFHAMHHLDERIDMSTAFRFHPVELALIVSLRASLMMVWAIPFHTLVLWRTIVLVEGAFQHLENVRFPRWVEKTIGRIIVLPGFHTVHHSADLPYTDTNFGSLLSIWDHLAGTTLLQSPLPGMKRGLDGHTDPNVLGILVAPFTLDVDRGGERAKAAADAPVASAIPSVT